MDEFPLGASVRKSFGLRDWGCILLLLLLAAGIRAWHIDHTKVTARDGVGFIRYAWELEHHSWREILRTNHHPPLYPMTILAVSYPVRWLVAGDLVSQMQLSGQLANALAGVLLVIPMFAIGRRLFDRRIGFGAAALFQCLPVSGRILSDALSEGVFLLLIALALLLAFQAFERYSAYRFAGCGACAGLAYLTRPEGVVLVAAVGLVLVGIQIRAASRRPWRKALAGAMALALAAVAVGGPYALVIGHFTNKTTGKEVLQAALSEDSDSDRWSEASFRPSLLPGPLPFATLAVYWQDAKHSETIKRLVWGLGALGGELLRGFHYIAWIPALIGLYCFRSRWPHQPGAWVMFVLCLLQGVLLWRVAYTAGYVADRHSLIFVLCGLFWTVAGLRAIGSMMARPMQATAAHRSWQRAIEIAHQLAVRLGPRRCAVVLTVALVIFPLPKTLEPLHTNRAGFYEAGRWLAEHANPTDQIVDPFSWVEFYSGQMFRAAAPASANVPVRYVVVGGSDNEHTRLPLMPQAVALAGQGTQVFEWPLTPIKRVERVLVYLVPPAK